MCKRKHLVWTQPMQRLAPQRSLLGSSRARVAHSVYRLGYSSEDPGFCCSPRRPYGSGDHPSPT